MASIFLDTIRRDESTYLRRVHQFPVLSAEEERTLWCRWRDDRDADAAHRLVTSHLRLVTRIARGLRGYGLPAAELIGEGNVGLMQALKRFDPERGFRFATYALWWIRAAMNEHVLQNWSLVKVGITTSQKRLFFNLRRLKAQMGMAGDGDLSPEQARRIAKVLDVAEQNVININRRLAGADHSLNVPVGSNDDGEWQDCLVDPADSQETAFAAREELAVRRTRLPIAMQTLNPRERHIIIERRLKDQPATLEVLSQHHRVSRERIRQIEMRAMAKLRKAMRDTGTAAQRYLQEAA